MSEQNALHKNNINKLNYSILDCNIFDLPFAETIEDFQRKQQQRPVDGIFGRGNYQAPTKVPGQ